MHITISIQALYDYKKDNDDEFVNATIFQFKHCTIIRVAFIARHWLFGISIQALYDYKAFERIAPTGLLSFQFKHCTIIRKRDVLYILV